MREINKIVIHCSATPPDMDIDANDIRDWHVNDNHWNDIGYHWVIRRDGEVEPGRDEAIAGAHVRGHNGDSIGVCLVGGTDADMGGDANFTSAQWAALETLVRELLDRYPEADVMGHRELDDGKECPCFDAPAWVETV